MKYLVYYYMQLMYGVSSWLIVTIMTFWSDKIHWYSNLIQSRTPFTPPPPSPPCLYPYETEDCRSDEFCLKVHVPEFVTHAVTWPDHPARGRSSVTRENWTGDISARINKAVATAQSPPTNSGPNTAKDKHGARNA